MIARIYTITFGDITPEKLGWNNATLIELLPVEKTWYQPEPGAKLKFGIPPWAIKMLWEVDAPWPDYLVSNNPRSPPGMVLTTLELSAGLVIVEICHVDWSLSRLQIFLEDQFPEQLP